MRISWISFAGRWPRATIRCRAEAFGMPSQDRFIWVTTHVIRTLNIVSQAGHATPGPTTSNSSDTKQPPVGGLNRQVDPNLAAEIQKPNHHNRSQPTRTMEKKTQASGNSSDGSHDSARLFIIFKAWSVTFTLCSWREKYALRGTLSLPKFPNSGLPGFGKWPFLVRLLPNPLAQTPKPLNFP